MEPVGIRELKNRLAYYLSLVKKGENIIVTDRRKPVAILHSLDQIEINASPEERLGALAMKGMVKLPPKGRKFDMVSKAAPIKGKPLSTIIIEGRR
ncbi:MAG: type II toxin-antitoxin system Phd/YefM family antitoxin [Nitrospiria bacterium]